MYYISPSLQSLSKEHLNMLKSLLRYNKQTKLPPPSIPLYTMPSSSLFLPSPGFKTRTPFLHLIPFPLHSGCASHSSTEIAPVKVTFMLEPQVLTWLDLCII